jgi:signal transduction histidine kinase
MVGSIAALVNLVGYVTGAALYALLLLMAVGEMRRASASAPSHEKSFDGLPLLTACLGIVWNLGSLAVWGLQSFSKTGSATGAWAALVAAGTFAALGFLPAVAVHSVLRQPAGWRVESFALGLVVTAYALSATSSALHFAEALSHQSAPSHWGLHLLTWGFAALTVGVLWQTRRRAQQWRRVGWVVALAVFAVSASHLSHHEGTQYPWWMELIGHHASLALILAILYQDYRFALADIFLKRALTLTWLIALVVAAQQFVVWPLWQSRAADTLTFGVTLALWVVTALLTPLLWRAAVWFVDSIVLRRADYEAVRQQLAAQITEHESAESVLDAVCQQLAQALTARRVSWLPSIAGESSNLLLPLIEVEPTASVFVPTSEAPQYKLIVGELAGGRRLLSDDLALLSHAALLAARRIDALRVTHERCARDLAEEEMRKLATEAELRALRAQINPHFLFNALTTIGYLIQTAPDKALETLMRLTALLRGVLRRGTDEFVTLGEELDLIEAYLDIERARFADRLRVLIDVPDNLRDARLPALLIQPLVENAIKHGISATRQGGEVVVLARQENGALQIWVRDTGAGVSEAVLQESRTRGVGLSSVESRLRAHYGEASHFAFHSAPNVGTTVELALPLTMARDNVADFAAAARRRRA